MDRALGMMAQLYSSTMHFDAAWARTSLEWLIANDFAGAAWLMEADGHTAGYMVLTIGYSLEFHGRYGLLDEIFIEGQFRSRGIGRQALAFVEEVCRKRGLHALRLEVARTNLHALALYRRAGFHAHSRDLMTKWL
jgi:ribosomal protein S18 acetylase RimI-like enzyme